MNEKQIQSIEKAFSFTLPHGYRSMLKSPPKLFAALLACTERECPGQSECFWDHELLVAINCMMRDRNDPEYFPFDPNDEDRPWPDRYFIIGSDVGGNFYCIAPATGLSRVYFWHQGDIVFSRYAKDMASFVKRIFKDYGEVESMDCEDDI